MSTRLFEVATLCPVEGGAGLGKRESRRQQRYFYVVAPCSRHGGSRRAASALYGFPGAQD